VDYQQHLMPEYNGQIVHQLKKLEINVIVVHVGLLVQQHQCLIVFVLPQDKKIKLESQLKI